MNYTGQVATTPAGWVLHRLGNRFETHSGVNQKGFDTEMDLELTFEPLRAGILSMRHSGRQSVQCMVVKFAGKLDPCWGK